MRLGLAYALIAATVAGVTARAAADEEAEGGTHRAWSHKGQVGVHAQVGEGFRVIFPYDEAYCGSADAVCSGRAPPFLELGISYAPSKRLELLAEVRLGLTTDFKPERADADSPRQLVFAPGIKV